MGYMKTVKRSMFWIFYILLLPIAFMVWIDKVAFNSKGIFAFFACLLSLLPGKTGSLLRVAYYYHTLENCSKDTAIGFGSFFSQREACIGKFVSIGAYSILGKVEIEDHVLIASRVSIPSGKRQHSTEKLILEKVRIGESTWIGEGAIVMADVGQRCIVSAGSVVTRPLPNDIIAIGNPARPLKKESLKMDVG